MPNFKHQEQKAPQQKQNRVIIITTIKIYCVHTRCQTVFYSPYVNSFNIKRIRVICRLRAGSSVGSKLVISSNLHTIFNLNKSQAFVSMYFNIFILPVPKSSLWQTIFITETNNLGGREGGKGGREGGNSIQQPGHLLSGAYFAANSCCPAL